MLEEDQINIGSAERPIWVPKKSLEPDTPEGREWWGMVAEGSVVLEEEALGLLLDKINAQKSQGDEKT